MTRRRTVRSTAASVGRRLGVVPPRPQPPATVAARLRQDGDLDGARAVLDEALAAAPDDTRLLDLAVRTASQQGRLTDAARLQRRLVAASARPENVRRLRLLEGRLRETDPSWRPVVEAPAPESPVRADGRGVLYLAKEGPPYLSNGFCTRTQQTAGALVRSGLPLTCVTVPGFPGALAGGEAPLETVVDGVHYRHQLPAAAHVAQLPYDEAVVLGTQLLAAEVARTRPALLHVASGHRGYETALAGDAVARWAGIPWVYEVRSFFETVWTSDERYQESAEQYHRRLATETRMMRAADALVTISGPMRDEIVEVHGVPAERVHVVRNAVDLDRFAPVVRDHDLAARLGLGSSFVLGYVSNISHAREAQELLVEATSHLVAAGHDVRLLLVGDGQRAPLVRDRAAELGVQDRVVLTGSVPHEDVASYYGLIDLFVVPRRSERAGRLVSPMKPFEAMSMRIPLLVSDVPALVELAGGGDRAAIFSAGDATDLARRAAEVMADAAGRSARVDAALSWVATQTWEAAAADLRAVYASLVPEDRL